MNLRGQHLEETRLERTRLWRAAVKVKKKNGRPRLADSKRARLNREAQARHLARNPRRLAAITHEQWVASILACVDADITRRWKRTPGPAWGAPVT